MNVNLYTSEEVSLGRAADIPELNFTITPAIQIELEAGVQRGGIHLTLPGFGYCVTAQPKAECDLRRARERDFQM